MEGGFRPGAVLLEKYRVESVLGRGGMGVVLRVMHLHLGEELALKILSPEVAGDPDVRARFLREAQSAVRLRGEHVTRVSDVGMLPEGAPYIVMEYLRGGDLSAELGRRGMLPRGTSSITCFRPARRWPRPMRSGSFIATSSRAICSWRTGPTACRW